MKIDKKLKDNERYKLVVTSIIQNMFKVDSYCKRIYVDINSCVSILFRYPDMNTDIELLSTITDQIEEFLLKYLENGTEIIFLYTVMRSKVHVEIYPEWCKTRGDRVDITKSGYLKKLIVDLNKYSSDNKLVSVINIKDKHPAMVVYDREFINKTKFLVLSKDPVFRCLPITNMSVYTGVCYVDMEDPERALPDNIELSNHDLLPYYLAIRGDEKNEYKGESKYGKVLSRNYVESYKLEIKSGLEHPLKERCDKYADMYLINKLLSRYEEEVNNDNK